jgi:hypothetical protein
VGLLSLPGVDLARGETPPGEEVRDPYGGSLEEYRAVGSQIDRLLTGWEPIWLRDLPETGGVI